MLWMRAVWIWGDMPSFDSPDLDVLFTPVGACKFEVEGGAGGHHAAGGGYYYGDVVELAAAQAAGQADTAEKLRLCHENLRGVFQNHIGPFLNRCEQAGFAHHMYFVCASWIIILMTLRLFDYLTFQKRLSMISN